VEHRQEVRHEPETELGPKVGHRQDAGRRPEVESVELDRKWGWRVGCACHVTERMADTGGELEPGPVQQRAVDKNTDARTALDPLCIE